MSQDFLLPFRRFSTEGNLTSRRNDHCGVTEPSALHGRPFYHRPVSRSWLVSLNAPRPEKSQPVETDQEKV